MGTEATKFVVKLLEFLGFACWYPFGLVTLRFLLGESLFEVNITGCSVLALLGVALQFLIWFKLSKMDMRGEIDKGVKYKIIGVKNEYF